MKSSHKSQGYIELPQAAGRTIARLRCWQPSNNQHSVEIRFADGEQIDITFASSIQMSARVGRLINGELRSKRIRT